MRTIIIGDVHACAQELQELLDACKLQAGDRIIFVGDLVHKGPDDNGVFTIVTNLMSNNDYEIVLVDGNHEEKHARWMRHEAVREATGKTNPTSNLNNILSSHPQMSEGTRRLLTSNDLWYLYYRFPIKGKMYIVVHGGMPGPQVIPTLPEPKFFTRTQLLGTRPSRAREKLKMMYRTRYLNVYTGRMIPLGAEKPEHLWWSEIYDGRFGTCVYGHQPFSEPKRDEHAIAIDTGCCYGHKLTALILGDGQERFLSVSAREQYYRGVSSAEVAGKRPSLALEAPS